MTRKCIDCHTKHEDFRGDFGHLAMDPETGATILAQHTPEPPLATPGERHWKCGRMVAYGELHWTDECRPAVEVAENEAGRLEVEWVR